MASGFFMLASLLSKYCLSMFPVNHKRACHEYRRIAADNNTYDQSKGEIVDYRAP
jgi:hypothetical protein